MTIDEQVERLRSRGVIVDEGTSSILMREGYYSIVNGYKAPFLDSAFPEERYVQGTRFEDLYALFCFDRDLREVTFKHLMQVEAIVRTVCTYTFAEHHRGTSDYLIQGNYCSEDEFKEFGLKGYVDNLLKLQSTLYKTMLRSNNDAIAHYRKNHDGIPIWVLANSLTFGTVEHFFHLMKPEERALVCKRIAEATGRSGRGNPYFDPKNARLSLDPIVKFRNKCAHDERLYCAKVGRRDPIIDYASMLQLVEPYLCRADYEEFLSDVMFTVLSYSDRSDLAVHVLRESGMSRLYEEAARVTQEKLRSDDSSATAVKIQKALIRRSEQQ